MKTNHFKKLKEYAEETQDLVLLTIIDEFKAELRDDDLHIVIDAVHFVRVKEILDEPVDC